MLLPAHSPTDVLNAYYAVWVQDNATALFLRWDTATAQWVTEATLPAFGAGDAAHPAGARTAAGEFERFYSAGGGCRTGRPARG